MSIHTARSTKTLRHTSILLAPFVIAALATVVWRWGIHKHGLYFGEEAETPFLYMIMPLVGFVYVIFASIAVSAALDRYQQLLKSVHRKDMEAYLDHHAQPLPGIMRGLVAIPSLILLLLAVLYQYADTDAGMVSVYTVTVVVSLTWLVISELDSIHRRSYFKSITPAHWQEAVSQPNRQHSPNERLNS